MKLDGSLLTKYLRGLCISLMRLKEYVISVDKTKIRHIRLALGYLVWKSWVRLTACTVVYLLFCDRSWHDGCE